MFFLTVHPEEVELGQGVSVSFGEFQFYLVKS